MRSLAPRSRNRFTLNKSADTLPEPDSLSFTYSRWHYLLAENNAQPWTALKNDGNVRLPHDIASTFEIIFGLPFVNCAERRDTIIKTATFHNNPEINNIFMNFNYLHSINYKASHCYFLLIWLIGG